MPAPCDEGKRDRRGQERCSDRKQAEGNPRERQSAHPEGEQERADEIARAQRPGDLAGAVRGPCGVAHGGERGDAEQPRQFHAGEERENVHSADPEKRGAGLDDERLGGNRRSAVPAQHPLRRVELDAAAVVDIGARLRGRMGTGPPWTA